MNVAPLLPFLRIVTLFVVSLIFCASLASISCPKFVFVEKNNDTTIVCQTKDIPAADVYWYKGSTSLSSPILRLEKGNPGGPEYNKGHFDITSDGSLIIRNATFNDEEVFTLVVFYQNSTSEKAKVTIVITMTPHPPCPEVTNCPSCRECTLNVTDSLSGQLMCSVAGSRPQIKTVWIIKSQRGLGLAIHEPVRIHNSYTDSWSTMVNVSYESNGCGEEAILQCVAKDDYRLLAVSHSLVRLFTDTCKYDLSEPPKIGITVIVPVLFVVVVLAAFLIYYIYKGKPSRGNISTPEDVTQVKDLPFISCFEEVYKRECRMDILPWGKSVRVDILYASCQCELTFSNGSTGTFSSKQVLEGAYIRNEKRVLIVGDAGYGKTMFAKQFVQQWIDETRKGYYIFFLSLKGVKENMKVSDILENKICTEAEVQSKDIEDLIEKYKSVFVLDGLHEMHFERKSNNTSKQDESISQSKDITSGSIVDLKVTIKDLLAGSVNDKYKNVQVWATSLDRNDVKSLFRKRDLKVKLNGFPESELREYVNRTCSFYASLEGLTNSCKTSVEKELVEEPVQGNIYTNTKENTCQSEKPKRETENGTHLNEEVLHIEGENDTPTEHLPLLHKYGDYSEMSIIGTKTKNVFDTVWGLMDKNEILDIFSRTPHLLILTIHVLSEKFARKVPSLNEVSINNTATIIDSVITCLKDKYIEESEGTFPPEEFNNLKEKIGDIAIQMTFGDKNSNSERVSLQGDITDQVKTGLAMGILKGPYSMNTHGPGIPSTTSLAGLQFSHYIFQDYFNAYFLLNNLGHLQKKIESLKQDEEDLSLGYLKFSSLFPKQSFEDLCNALLKHKMYTHLFSCLYERGDEQEIERIGRLLKAKDIVISCLASRHQREAIKVFLQACCILGVELWQISCDEKHGLTFLKTVKLPKIECIEFSQLTFSEEDLKLCLEWLHQIRNPYCVRFHECKLPLDLSLKYQRALNDLNNLPIKVEGLRKNL